MKTELRKLVMVGLASFLLAGCCTTQHASKGWEYKAVRLNPMQQNFVAELNAASKGGWKLFTVVPTDSGGYGQYIFQKGNP